MRRTTSVIIIKAMRKDMLVVVALLLALGSAMHLGSQEQVAAVNDRLAKEKYLESVEIRPQVISEGWYKLEYFHTFSSNNPLILNPGKTSIVTARSYDGSKFFIKRHPTGGVSVYETLKESKTNKWVKVTKEGTSLVDSEASATWFQVLGVGSYYVFQFTDPTNPLTTFQWGVDNRPVGTQLRLINGRTELFKLVPA